MSNRFSFQNSHNNDFKSRSSFFSFVQNCFYRQTNEKKKAESLFRHFRWHHDHHHHIKLATFSHFWFRNQVSSPESSSIAVQMLLIKDNFSTAWFCLFVFFQFPPCFWCINFHRVLPGRFCARTYTSLQKLANKLRAIIKTFFCCFSFSFEMHPLCWEWLSFGMQTWAFQIRGLKLTGS